MPRNVFYSFHYSEDSHRVSQIRNFGAIHDNPELKDHDWEKITRGGDAAIERWIEGQLDGTTCTVVLIGAQTAGRKWITHEIIRSWIRGNGVLGIHIHGLRNMNSRTSTKGKNPFDWVVFDVGTPSERSMAGVAPVYDPTHFDSKRVYATIKDNIGAWVEHAIKVRQNFK